MAAYGGTLTSLMSLRRLAFICTGTRQVAADLGLQRRLRAPLQVQDQASF